MSRNQPQQPTESEQLNTDTLPITIQEGDGTETPRIYIHRNTCEECGYDRAKVRQQHGDFHEECMNCGAVNYNGEWTPQPNTKQHLSELERAAQKDNTPVENYGEFFGPLHNRYVVFGREDTDLLKVFRCGDLEIYCTTIGGDTLEYALKALYQNDIEYLEEVINTEAENHTPLDQDTKVLTHSMNAPANNTGIHVSVLKERGIKTREAIKLSREIESFPPVHITPNQ